MQPKIQLRERLNGFLPTPAFGMVRNSVDLPPTSAFLPGEGGEHPEIMFVGEAPSEMDVQVGRPFAGPSGILLSKMIEAMKLKREEVFITNAVPFCLPNQRAPRSNEIEYCRPFLDAEIKRLKPKIIVALGATAEKSLLGTTSVIEGTKLIATFHPAHLLINPAAKKDCWDALQLAMAEINKLKGSKK